MLRNVLIHVLHLIQLHRLTANARNAGNTVRISPFQGITSTHLTFVLSHVCMPYTVDTVLNSKTFIQIKPGGFTE